MNRKLLVEVECFEYFGVHVAVNGVINVIDEGVKFSREGVRRNEKCQSVDNLELLQRKVCMSSANSIAWG